MTLTCKEVEEKIYGYHRLTGDTGTNLVADRINAVSAAIGFNSTLFKEEFNPAKHFAFNENDVELIKKFMALTQSKEGKRLRCFDYKGAGIECIIETTAILCVLASHVGVPNEWLQIEQLKVEEFTKQFVLRELIQEKTNDYDEDFAEHFFAPVGNCHDDDKLDEIDRQIFLEFLYRHLEWSPLDIRRIYWFFVSKKADSEYKDLVEGVKEMKKLSKEELFELKEILTKQVKLHQELSNDKEYIKLLDERDVINDNTRKLQDNKMFKRNEKKLQGILSSHIQDVFNIDIEFNNSKKKPVDNEQFYNNEIKKHNLSRELLNEAIAWYFEWKEYRKHFPISDDDERIIEITFKQRFGTAMFN